ncbi:uncharacterized protein HKW66_Vig0028430 [Vigna angularis]|uniref:Transmembrane protein n=1 Tax=Phaseolus angularis TaxID=3914 RepID=A0A8T0L905_PHAAN|nr:uncharacterized protein LOC108338925 [Vigna angularis]KAG2408021.1 uncharacterized protein HKW66_Vig0028430 [Vigna angularis]
MPLSRRSHTHARHRHSHNINLFTVMLGFTSNSNHSFFFLFFCLFLFLFSASTATPSDCLEDVNQRYEKVLVVPPWTARRSTAEGASPRNGTLVLAKERTRRQDWFNGFTLYKGGWNISNAYYIKSVMSTAFPFFVVAAAWFVIFGVVLLIGCACCCCCNGGEPSDYSKIVHYFSLFLLILSTIITIGGCAQLYSGQGNIDGSTSETLDYVLNQAQFVAENLNTISNYFDSAKRVVREPPLPLDIDLGPDLDDIKLKIDRAADTLSNKVSANSKTIRKAIDVVRLALVIVAVVLFFVAFLRLFFCLLAWKCPVYSLVVIGWILVTSTLVLCAAFIFVHNVTGDTCVAMDEWVVNPTAHTALDDIFPCVEKKAVLETYLKSKILTYKIVEAFDKVISNFTNSNTQSGPLVPLLCNPFNSDLTSRNCSSGEVTFQNAIQVWKNFTCQVSSSEKCTSAGRLTQSIYTKLGDAVNVTYGLFEYGPFIADLVDCNFVRRTFKDISTHYCPPLRRYCEQVYLGSVLVSAAVMLSLISSLFFVREQWMFLHNNGVL